MIDGRYTDEEWLAVRGSVDDDGIVDFARDTIEQAAREYLNGASVAERMKNASRARERWADAKSKADALLLAINGLGPWEPGTWDDTGDPDPYGDRRQLISLIQKFSDHSEFCRSEYEYHAKSFSRQQDPNRERLYAQLFHAWTEDMWRELRWSDDGPLVRFFRAALAPVLSAALEEPPASTSIRTMMEREKARRAARQQSGDGLKPKAPSQNIT